MPGYQCFSDTRALQFVDVAPQCISSEVDIGGLQFETISEAVDRFNEQIKRNPLPGKRKTVFEVIISERRLQLSTEAYLLMKALKPLSPNYLFDL